ncbi:uncharacterized protein BO95DRAFT_141387 [Aspergillus brunneoviolaceus CBS 621.78]|uniref:Uncharacterized protein n=1 Tax=Aspergillus brunneoviolaceus CBS 621.78 TaxID=1450534 RepID=A0ACD1G8E1_9EURO|nr:hypothetical protein BO95DRAFT_141387 [Aspergillus brunneoviolaceus CBS 621.78]RAH45442.1 hypothetical protein BO95DRAFT_141387 [Aspergillus brunneoviolaceus CBS 621.78]
MCGDCGVLLHFQCGEFAGLWWLASDGWRAKNRLERVYMTATGCRSLRAAFLHCCLFALRVVVHGFPLCCRWLVVSLFLSQGVGITYVEWTTPWFLRCIYPSLSLPKLGRHLGSRSRSQHTQPTTHHWIRTQRRKTYTDEATYTWSPSQATYLAHGLYRISQAPPIWPISKYRIVHGSTST